MFSCVTFSEASVSVELLLIEQNSPLLRGVPSILAGDRILVAGLGRSRPLPKSLDLGVGAFSIRSGIRVLEEAESCPEDISTEGTCGNLKLEIELRFLFPAGDPVKPLSRLVRRLDRGVVLRLARCSAKDVEARDKVEGTVKDRSLVDAG